MTDAPLTADDPESVTSLTAAAARAAHPLVDRAPIIFADPLARALLGAQADELIAYHLGHGEHPVLAGARAQVACRSRYTEQRVAASGVGQYVLLGAGLDSFAYRSTLGVRVFELDRAPTQAAKRRRLAAAGIGEPAEVTYAPLDVERSGLGATLAAHGFDAGRPAVVGWLGVSMYLSRSALAATLNELARLAPGSEVVFDYFVPPELRDPDGQVYADAVAPMAAGRGEPWRTVLTPDDVTALAAAAGIGTVVHIGQDDFDVMRDRSDALRPSTLSRLAHLTI